MPVTYNNSTYNRQQPTQNPGFYRQHKLSLAGRDISDQVVEFNIFENLNGPLTGTMTLVDTTNLIQDLPIMGDELVEFIADDEGTGDRIINSQFYVYKIGERTSPNHGTTQYNLYFISKEGWEDSCLVFSKGYNERFDVAAKDVFDKVLMSKKKFLVETCDGPQCFVVPYWTPLETLSWMASRAQSSNSSYRGGNYICFETVKGWNFLSIDNLLDKNHNKPYATLTVKPLRPTKDYRVSYDSRMPNDTMTFEDHQIINTFDQIMNMKTGMYANRIRVIDIMKKEPMDAVYDYYADFNKEKKHLEGGLTNKAYPLVRSKFKPLKHFDTYHKVVLKHQGLFSDEKDGGNNIEKWVAQKTSQLQSLEQFKIRGTLPGHIGMVAGMQVSFSLPMKKNISINQDSQPDPYYSGNYLITAIRRQFLRDKFYLHIEMVRDSLGLSLDGTSIGQTIQQVANVIQNR